MGDINLTDPQQELEEIPYEENEKRETPEERSEREECEDDLVQIGEFFDEADRSFRESQIIELRKNNLYWDNAQRLFWDSALGTWVDANGLHTPEQKARYSDYEGASDRVVNIYRPHGESVISAMSIATPVVQFFPDDADSSNDIAAAKAYSKISKIIQKHNNASLLFIRALYIFYNQGIVFGYNYTHESEKYGTFEYGIEKPVKVQETVDNPIDGSTTQVETIIPQVVGKGKGNKVRECIEVYGALHVSIPSWCRKQEDVPILSLNFEKHESDLRHTYREKFDEIMSDYPTQAYERQGRLKNTSDMDSDLCTVTVRWYRPQAYAHLNRDNYERLLAKYPKGCKAVIHNRKVLELVEENLDDHWTITFPIFSETIHQKPQGSMICDIQEIRNDVISNADETIRQSITDTFADPEVLSFEDYKNEERRPGQIFPAKPRTGKSLSDAFWSNKAASLSQELDIFIKRLDSDAQFSSGAFPSIFGGPAITGSKTAAEYSMSRAQALQRLSTYWKMMGLFWAELIGRATTAHARNLLELKYNDRMVVKNGNTFENIIVKTAELDGKVGSIEPETSENFPINAAQKRDIFLKMLEIKNPIAESIMTHPENSQMVVEAIGMPELYIPGADDRTKQRKEIQELTKEQDEMNPEPIHVEVDPEADNHQVHLETCRAWMVSEVGQYIKVHNPDAYLRVVEHAKMHKDLLMPPAAPPNMDPKMNPQAPNSTGSM